MKKIISLLILTVFLFSCTVENKGSETWEVISNYADTLESSISDTRKVVNQINKVEKYSKQISSEDFKKKLETGNYTLIDVRTPEELITYWKISENQLLININDKSFSDKIKKLDKNKKYLIYCWHWNRSKVAREFMEKEWFLYLDDLKWWIDIWKN
jgi:rhodanese-related sulfurtransferase